LYFILKEVMMLATMGKQQPKHAPKTAYLKVVEVENGSLVYVCF